MQFFYSSTEPKKERVPVTIELLGTSLLSVQDFKATVRFQYKKGVRQYRQAFREHRYLDALDGERASLSLLRVFWL